MAVSDRMNTVTRYDAIARTFHTELAMFALVLLEVDAALRHHFILKDGVVRRMWR